MRLGNVPKALYGTSGDTCKARFFSPAMFIAQLVEHRTGIAEVTGSNPVEALIFSGFFPIA